MNILIMNIMQQIVDEEDKNDNKSKASPQEKDFVEYKS